MNLWTLLMSGVMVILSFKAWAHPTAEGKALVRLKVADFRNDLETISQMGIDIAGVSIPEQTVDVILDEGEFIDILFVEGIEVISKNKIIGLATPDSGYHTYAEVEEELRAWCTKYPSLAKLVSIGKSLEGREIWALKISDKVSESEVDEPRVLFNAMHHAREVMTTEVAMDTIEHLLTKYGVDAKVTAWVDGLEVWVVPMVNPDGNNRVWNGNSMWRKNGRAPYGVDINRNYPYRWGACNGSSPSPMSETFRGKEPASEPETKAVMGLVESIRPILNLSYHSYSELVIYPYGCDGQRTETRQTIEDLGKSIARAMVSDRGRGTYTAGTSWETLYSVDGNDIDWMYHEYQVMPFVIELNSKDQGFQPPYSWRDKTVIKARAGWATALDRAMGSGVQGQVQGLLSVEGSQVVAENMATGSESIPYRLTSDGRFHLLLDPGMYRLRFQTPGAISSEQTVIVGASRETIDFDVRLQGP